LTRVTSAGEIAPQPTIDPTRKSMLVTPFSRRKSSPGLFFHFFCFVSFLYFILFFFLLSSLFYCDLYFVNFSAPDGQIQSLLSAPLHKSSIIREAAEIALSEILNQVCLFFVMVYFCTV
jgi:hypothetical protein